MYRNGIKSQKLQRKSKKEKDKKIGKKEEGKGTIVSKLLDNAKHSLYTYEFDLALKFCHRALEKDPLNIEALDLQGSIYTEIGDVENAKKSLQKSSGLDDKKGNYERFMSLGQLSVGKEAVEFYQKGIKAIQDFISQKKSEDPKSDTNAAMKDLSSAYLQLAEMYLTDECDLEEAEELCKTYLDQAFSADPGNIPAYHSYASYCIIIGDPQKAKEYMDKSLDLWLPRLKELHQTATTSTEDEGVLDVACRIGCCKILIELQEYDKASEILELLLDEDEQLVEVWYLLAWLNYLKGAGYQGNVKCYMKKALELATETSFDDEEMMSHMKEILNELADVKEEEEEEDGCAMDEEDGDDVNGVESNDEDEEEDEDEEMDERTVETMQ